MFGLNPELGFIVLFDLRLVFGLNIILIQSSVCAILVFTDVHAELSLIRSSLNSDLYIEDLT